MKLSAFGDKFTGNSGIVELMDDLGNALSENPNMLFLGGGNPGRIPEMEQAFHQRMAEINADPDLLFNLLGLYQPTKGEHSFRTHVASLLKKEFDWDLSAKNIAISNGSQAAFFILFNMLAGPTKSGQHRTIHLPMAPEYIGYSDIGLCENLFSATHPEIEELGDHLFKYRVDFSQLNIDDSVAALCVSRPTNPTGNVLTDNEITQLDAMAREHDIPFILDGAYGLPFPGIIFNEAKPHWNDNTILVLSLSKLGLPGVRTGIIVANEAVIQAYSNASTIANLASGNLGPSLSKEWFKTGEILKLSEQHIKPFYQLRAQQAVQWFKKAMGDLPFHIHKPEGAIFLWLWFEGLPISSQLLYERLKERGVLIIPGQNFFPGIEADWQHTQECIRVSYAQEESVVQEGIRIIAEEVQRAFCT
uniref:Valine--pyruvate aminotransferase (EC) n=1 Tax=uncultured Thiotrichaceae bacterium TaxID=298394 RepID=A0A6S6SRN3_9GAMM|nr:MAG: Valine--pyruvate aminotransferase (EC [uncultured Thiotrichaceae bacterium]